MGHPTLWPPCPSCGAPLARHDSATLEEGPGSRIVGLILRCPCGIRWTATQTVTVCIETVAVKLRVPNAPARAEEP